MKQDAVLIPLDPSNVDFGALYEALDDQKIGGAILDVWPVYSCYNVIMLSLLGSVSFFDAGDTPTQDGCLGFQVGLWATFRQSDPAVGRKGRFQETRERANDAKRTHTIACILTSTVQHT
jgi:hypothetical protein